MKKLAKQSGGQGLVCSDLLSFFVGERFWVGDEFIAEIVAVDDDRVKIKSDGFNGWALKAELKAIPA